MLVLVYHTARWKKLSTMPFDIIPLLHSTSSKSYVSAERNIWNISVHPSRYVVCDVVRAIGKPTVPLEDVATGNILKQRDHLCCIQGE
jgi:hypothetical protein